MAWSLSSFFQREGIDPREHEPGAGQLHARHRLAEDQRAEEQRRYRTDHPGLRGGRGADALDRGHGHEHGEDRTEYPIHQREPVNLGRLHQHARRAQQEELGDAGHARHAHRVGHQAQRADARDHLAGAEQVDGVRDGRAQHQQRAEEGAAPGAAGRARQVVHEHQHDAAIGQPQRRPLGAPDAPLEDHHVRQQHEGGRQEQDQALEPDRDVLQAEEVEVARQVVAEQAQHDDAPAVLLRQRRLGSHLPERHCSKHRKREQHSEGDQSDCIDVVAIQQFGDDGFRGKQDGAGDGDRQAGDEGRAW